MNDKDKAAKKCDIAICKLQDLFYMGLPDSVIYAVEKALDAVREVEAKIENS